MVKPAIQDEMLTGDRNIPLFLIYLYFGCCGCYFFFWDDYPLPKDKCIDIRWNIVVNKC